VRFELDGLEPDNFLAFLALVGALRILERRRDAWDAKVLWDGTPLRPRLLLANNLDKAALCGELAEGIADFRGEYRFTANDIKYTADEFRTLAFEAVAQGRERSDLVAALASDGALKRDDKKNAQVEATALCTMLGSGHQSFLRRLENAAASDTDCETIERALFEPWTYSDVGESFRWDPVEDRRYAYQAGDPSETANKIGTVIGANRLAAIGFGIWGTSPTRRGLKTRGVDGYAGTRTICWPLNDRPAGLPAIRALLAHPSLTKSPDASPSPIDDLGPYGVRTIARARRYQNDKYFNISRAQLS